MAIGPHLGHALLLIVLAVVLVSAGQFLALLAAQQLHVEGHHSLRGYADLMRNDARWLIPSEALGYLLVLAAAVPIFRAMWHRGFAAGVHWNLAVAKRYAGRLVLCGLGCGCLIALLGSQLPMPQDPPIMADMMHSPAGAWMMLLFGVTGAPLFEELVFRGFLLPAFLNAFRWLSQKGDLAPSAVLWLGVPFSVVFTSLPFALLHSQQVSHAWAPVALIGLISLVLCVVRLRLDSLASSTLVHSAYNFTLFAGILVQTSGFRHLDRLAH
ncbi:CPBP family intramembrane metalloprotease [Acidipila sp. EB88]|nr:CPBP family intramembrane metalloprotease [Acidipila sp. EB88]